MSTEIGLEKGIFLAIGGPSGSGKSTVIKELEKHFDSRFFGSVTYTTRVPRDGEINGEHYHFVDISQLPIFRKNPRYSGFVQARGSWYWIDSLELIEASRRKIDGIYLTTITQVNEFIERRNIFSDLHWIWLTATNSELCSRLMERGDRDVESSKKHNELLERQDRRRLVSLEISTGEHGLEETLNQIINFIKKLRKEKS